MRQTLTSRPQAGGRRCLETRATPEGHRRRRYADGSVTIEVPLSAWQFLNRAGRGQDRVAAHKREVQREAVRRRAVELAQGGWKPLAIAHELEVSERSVQRWISACSVK
jgi:hypothetical protein